MPAVPSDDRWAEHQRAHDRDEEAHRREHDAERRSETVADAQLERRLDELNKLRSEVLTDRAQFMRSDTFVAEHKALSAQFESTVEKLAAQFAAAVDKLALRVDAVEKAYDRAEGAVNTWRWIAGFLGVGGIGLIVWSFATFGHP